MAYSVVVLMFVVIPLVLCLINIIRLQIPLKHFGAAAISLLSIVLFYAVPWDHQAAIWHMWTWRHTATVGWYIWSLPIEEYAFMVALTLLIISIYAFATQKSFVNTLQRFKNILDIMLIGIGVTVAFLLLSLFHSMSEIPRTHPMYLAFLLLWAGPVILLQWGVGGRICWQQRHLIIAIAIGAMTWFGLADVIALHFTIWRFSATDLLGWYIGPVPIEEELFYGLTAVMLGQGYLILMALVSSGVLARIPHLHLGWRSQQTVSQKGQL